MKNILAFVLLGSFLAACTNKQNNQEVVSEVPTFVDPASAPVMSFEKETYDFGIINEGQSVVYDFEFKNTGKGPLLISNATATCGCTVPEYPKDPILPGQKGTIHVVFNSTGKPGMQNKVVTLNVNTVSGTQQLYLTGNVIPKNK